MFIGLTLTRMNSNVTDIGLMVGWLLSLVTFIVIVEIFENFYNKKIFNFNVGNGLSELTKNILYLIEIMFIF